MEEQKKILIAKALDAVRLSELKNIPKYIGFLSPGEATAVQEAIGKRHNICFFGGFEDAERRIFGVLPEYLEESIQNFPIKAIRIEFNQKYSLTHRDILGTFMSTGVSRTTVGDILVFKGVAFAFVLEEVAEYFKNQINKIKNVGVNLYVLDDINEVLVDKTDNFSELKFTLSSMRLDAVVSGLTGKSRSISEKLILDGFVFVNSFEVTKTTKKVQCGDVITVRKFGKFVITSSGNYSKKGREIISAKKYI